VAEGGGGGGLGGAPADAWVSRSACLCRCHDRLPLPCIPPGWTQTAKCPR
jgi:hypothetical protein